MGNYSGLRDGGTWIIYFYGGLQPCSLGMYFMIFVSFLTSTSASVARMFLVAHTSGYDYDQLTALLYHHRSPSLSHFLGCTKKTIHINFLDIFMCNNIFFLYQ